MGNASAELVLDGERITSLDAFYDEISRVLVPGAAWGRNLDALNDILFGGFGTPAWPYVIRWRNSDQSVQHLGYRETVRYVERKLSRCHPSNRAKVLQELELAKREEGPTIFDRLVEVIRSYESNGDGEPLITLILD
jgi:RNAse (barnase) inhibitor barstar